MKYPLLKKFIILTLLILTGIIISSLDNKSNASNLTGIWDISADDGQSNVTATLYDDGSFIISGTGAIKDFATSEDRGYYENILEIKNTVVEQGVTSIGRLTFDRCNNLENISLPEGIKKIGEGSFYECHKLKNIKLPDSVEAIGESSFVRCYKISDIQIPYGVKTIEENSFYNCSNLKTVDIPNTVTEIGERAFYKCKNLKIIDIPNTVEVLGKGTFEECISLEEIKAPQNFTNIGENAFLNAQIKLNTVNDYEYKNIELPGFIKNHMSLNPNSYELINCELDNDNTIKVNTMLFGKKIIQINDGSLKGLKIIISINSLSGYIPEFYGTTNITLKVRDKLDLKNSYYRLFAKDYEDGNITKNIKVVSNNVNTSEVGNYEIRYEVSDSNNNKIYIIVPVQVIEDGDRKIQRTLYTLPDESALIDASLNRAHYHDRQDLGIYLPAGKSFRIRQINLDLNDSIDVNFLGNDCLQESGITATVHGIKDEVKNDNQLDLYTYLSREDTNVEDISVNVNNDKIIKIEPNSSNYFEMKNIVYTNVKYSVINGGKKENKEEIWEKYNEKSYNSVPFVKTLYGVDEHPILEIILNEDIKPLDYYTYGDSTEDFKAKWNNSNNGFAIIEGDRATFLIPYKDLAKLAISIKEEDETEYKWDYFSDINDILGYYDDIIRTYDKWVGLSDDSAEVYNKNVKTKFFIKGNIHGVGGAAYNVSNYIYSTKDSLITFLHNGGSGWAPLHEIGHGYQGLLKSKELYLTEISNNFLAYYYQKNKMEGEDWLSAYINDSEDLQKMIEAVKSNKNSYLDKLPLAQNEIENEESNTGVNRFASRLYAYINLLDKIDYQKALPYTSSYCRKLAYEGIKNDYSATDIIARCFSESSGYNVIPYLESWKLKVSEQLKKEIYNKHMPIVYYLRDLTKDDDNAMAIKNQLGLSNIYSLISNNDLKSYELEKQVNLYGDIKIILDESEYNILKGSKILIKSEDNIVHTEGHNIGEIDVSDSAILNFKDFPVGIYTLETTRLNYDIEPKYIAVSQNKENKVDLTLTEKQMDNIEIEVLPSKTSYYVGEDLDLSGIKVKAIYNDGTYEYIKDYSIDGYSKNKVGKQMITVTYGGKETTFEVEVTEISVTGVKLNGDNSVNINNSISLICSIEPKNATNKKVVWTSSNENIATVDENGVVTGKANGTAKITVITEDGGYTATKTITVKTPVTGIEVTKSPTKTSYIKGEELNLEGIEITATYEDGTRKIIELPEESFIGYDKNTVGEQTVTVTYGEGIKAEFKVNVFEKLKIDVNEYEVIKEDEVTYIEGIMPNTTIEKIISKIITNGTIEIYKGNTKITNEEQLIATGMEVVIKFREQEVRYTIVVKGDLNGDGKIRIGDLSRLSRYAAGLDTTLEGANLRASDVVKDGRYGRISDISKMSRVLAGLDNM